MSFKVRELEAYSFYYHACLLPITHTLDSVLVYSVADNKDIMLQFQLRILQSALTHHLQQLQKKIKCQTAAVREFAPEVVDTLLSALLSNIQQLARSHSADNCDKLFAPEHLLISLYGVSIVGHIVFTTPSFLSLSVVLPFV